MQKLKRISLSQSADGNIYVHDLVETITTIQNKIDEIVDVLPYEKYPLKEGEREMWAILGVDGAIYGFAQNKDKAEETRDRCWNIGKRKPERYRVTFKKI